MRLKKNADNVFIIALITIFLLSDFALAKWDFVNVYPVFRANDYGKTVIQYGGKNWDAAIFGNSGVVSAVRNNLIEGQYVNLGIVYGKITDLEQMIKQDYININKELVIGANYLVFLDSLRTNPYYPWHRKFYEPYIYFYRMQIRQYFERVLPPVWEGKNIFSEPEDPFYLRKEITPGHLTGEEIQEKIKTFDEQFGNVTLDDFEDNIRSLNFVIDYAKKNNIELKFVWMPLNPVFELPNYVYELTDKVNKILSENNIEYADWTNNYEASYFYDLGHLSWQEGSVKFTEELLNWLKQ